MLSALKDQMVDVNTTVRQTIIAKADEEAEVESALREKHEELGLLEAKLRRVEDSYRREKEAQENLMGTQNEELTGLEERLAEIRDTSEEESQLTASNRRIVECKARLAVQREEHERLKERLSAAIMETVSKCADHKERVSRGLAEVQEKFRQRLEGLLMGENIAAGKQRQVAAQRQRASDGKDADETFGLDESWHAAPNHHTHGMGVADISIGMSPIPSVKNDVSHFEQVDESAHGLAMDLSIVAPEPRLKVVKNLADMIDQAAEENKFGRRARSTRRN